MTNERPWITLQRKLVTVAANGRANKYQCKEQTAFPIDDNVPIPTMRKGRKPRRRNYLAELETNYEG